MEFSQVINAVELRLPKATTKTNWQNCRCELVSETISRGISFTILNNTWLVWNKIDIILVLWKHVIWELKKSRSTISLLQLSYFLVYWRKLNMPLDLMLLLNYSLLVTPKWYSSKQILFILTIAVNPHIHACDRKFCGNICIQMWFKLCE